MLKPLLILDLDETLIRATEEPLDYPCDFILAAYAVYKRPFLNEFLDTVLEWFDVAVWSSAPSYVQGVTERLFMNLGTLRFAWSNERCTRRYDPELLEEYWVKDLRKVRRAGYALERVVVLDDTPAKLERHYGNHLRLRPFMGERDDRELQLVLPFLKWLRTVENVRLVEKRAWRTFVPKP